MTKWPSLGKRPFQGLKYRKGDGQFVKNFMYRGTDLAAFLRGKHEGYLEEPPGKSADPFWGSLGSSGGHQKVHFESP